MSSARRGLGAVVLLLVLVVVLAGVGFGMDRLARGVAEDRVARELQSRLGTAAPPQVDIEGYPFLTQVLRGSLSTVHVVAADAVPPDRPDLRLASVDLRLHGVRSSQGFRTVTASRVEGSVGIGYDDTRALTGRRLTPASGGRVVLTVPTGLGGASTDARVTGRPVVDPAQQTLTLADPQLSLGGVDVDDTVTRALLGSVLKPVPLTGIPYGLRVEQLDAEPDDLVAQISGQQVEFGR